MSLLVVGGVFREVVVGAADRDVRLAGSGFYAAAAAARLGAEVTLLGTIGSEDLELAQVTSEDLGVDAQWRVSEGTSGTFGYELSNRGLVCRGYRPAEGALGPVPAVAEGFDVTVVFGHPEWDTCAAPEIRRATAGSVLLWDRQGWMSRATERRAALQLPAARRILLENWGEWSETMAAATSDAAEPPDGFDVAVVKDGRWGVRLHQRNSSPVELASYSVDPVDELGSGDVLAGALAAALGHGDLADSCETAAAAAAAAIEQSEPLPASTLGEDVARLKTGARNPLLVQPARSEADVAVLHATNAAGAEWLVALLEGEGFRPKVRSQNDGRLSVAAGGQAFEVDDVNREAILSWLGEKLAPA